jgi:hypothetical protein
MGDLANSVTLRRAVVRALEGEISECAEFTDPQLYVGGEVRLDFEGQSVFVSWVQNEGWPDFCSIGVRPESHFRQDSTLVDWDVSDLPPWSKCVGRRLLTARVFAIDETPQVVEFSFDGQGFWMASGQERDVGDGTDLLIRSGPFPGLADARLAWPV